MGYNGPPPEDKNWKPLAPYFPPKTNLTYGPNLTYPKKALEEAAKKHHAAYDAAGKKLLDTLAHVKAKELLSQGKYEEAYQTIQDASVRPEHSSLPSGETISIGGILVEVKDYYQARRHPRAISDKRARKITSGVIRRGV